MSSPAGRLLWRINFQGLGNQSGLKSLRLFCLSQNCTWQLQPCTSQEWLQNGFTVELDAQVPQGARMQVHTQAVLSASTTVLSFVGTARPVAPCPLLFSKTCRPLVTEFHTHKHSKQAQPTNKHRGAERQTETHRDTERDTERDKERPSETRRDRERDKGTQRESGDTPRARKTKLDTERHRHALLHTMLLAPSVCRHCAARF